MSRAAWNPCPESTADVGHTLKGDRIHYSKHIPGEVRGTNITITHPLC